MSKKVRKSRFGYIDLAAGITLPKLAEIVGYRRLKTCRTAVFIGVTCMDTAAVAKKRCTADFGDVFLTLQNAQKMPCWRLS